MLGLPLLLTTRSLRCLGLLSAICLAPFSLPVCQAWDGDRGEANDGIVFEIKLGDDEEVQRFEPLALAASGKPETAEQLMRRLAEREGAGFRFESRGNGATFFVTSINGRANEGRGGKNWFLLVNGELSKRGAGTTEVPAGATVQWHYRGGGLE